MEAEPYSHFPPGAAPQRAGAGAPALDAPIGRSGLLRMNEAELVTRIRAGDGRAFKALVDQFSDSLYGLARSLVGNAADAEDVLQQTFLGAFNRIHAFEGRSSLHTWLARILFNQASKNRRSRRVRRAMSIHDSQEGRESSATGDRGLTSQSGVHGVDSRVDIDLMLEALSPEHREVIVLRELHRFSYDEIAQSLGLPRGTVESRLFRRARNCGSASAGTWDKTGHESQSLPVC